MRREISYKDPKSGKTYQLKSKVCLHLIATYLRRECLTPYSLEAAHQSCLSRMYPPLVTSASCWAPHACLRHTMSCVVQTAVLFVRPRGWHLLEKHMHVDGQAVPAAIFDFALYFFHNAKELLKRNTGKH